MKVAIIGGGASGLASAKYCHEAGLQCDVFEQTDKIGGVWNYTDQVGLDENGLPVQSSMYKDLSTNLPKETMIFPGFKYPESTPKKSSYITQPEVLQYVLNFAEKSNVLQYIRYHKYVTNIKPLPANRWSVTVQDARSKVETTAEYDAVMVCNGHYSKPRMPQIAGMGTLHGAELHSHDYKSADRFTGKRVTVVGAGPSGVDVAKQIATKAAKVYLSHRGSVKTGWSWTLPESDNITHKPVVSEIFPDHILFEDGTEEPMDAIVYCTGFLFNYFFLSKDCKIVLDDNWVKPLYKHIINIYKPTMAFIGLNFYVCPFPLYDLQTRFFVAYLTGKFKLPSEADMLQELDEMMESRISAGMPKRHAHLLDSEQQHYFDDLALTAHIKPLPNYLVRLYEAIRKNRNRSAKYEVISDEDFIEVQ